MGGANVPGMEGAVARLGVQGVRQNNERLSLGFGLNLADVHGP